MKRPILAFAWAAMTFTAFIASAYGYKCDQIAPDPVMWALYVGGAIGGVACVCVGGVYAVEQRLYRAAGGLIVYDNATTRETIETALVAVGEGEMVTGWQREQSGAIMDALRESSR